MDVIFVFVGLFFLGSIASASVFLIALAISALIGKNVKKCAKGFGLSLVCFVVSSVIGITLGAVAPDMEEEKGKVSVLATDEKPTTETVLSYDRQIIDLNNIGQYPWGNLLYDALMSIGASDIREIKCEVDSSDVTFKITTETKRLWASVGGKYGDEWYVEWIRNYDESEIYYYVTDRSTIYEERLYSYETGEVIHEPVPGSSSKYPLVVTVEEFVREINADIDAAKDKYNGKWVEITGRITDYSRYNGSSMSGYYLYGEYAHEGLKIVCWQNKGDDTQFTKVGRMCTCTGIVREVSTFNATEIVDCQIVFE